MNEERGARTNDTLGRQLGVRGRLANALVERSQNHVLYKKQVQLWA